jgi:hypothetical protein
MLVFKLLPFRSFEKEGDKIKLESPLRIKNIENRCYLSLEDMDDESGAVDKMKESEIMAKIKRRKFNIVTTYSQT